MSNIQWRSAALAGIAAGVVATAFQIALWWISADPLPWILFRDARFAAATVMGQRVLPPPASFDAAIMLVATLVHFALSIAYGLALAFTISRFRASHDLTPCVLTGAVAGLAIYAINMHGFTLVFPWFSAARGWITASTHAVFGMVAAIAYRAMAMRTYGSTRPLDARAPP